MRSTHRFDFSIRDKVKVTGLENIPGKITQMVVDQTGKQYQVAYWDRGERRTAWVDADEIVGDDLPSPIEGNDSRTGISTKKPKLG